MKHKVTVLITVGPNPVYKEYLPEAFKSVLAQTYLPDEILLIDDRADLGVREYPFMPGNHLCGDIPIDGRPDSYPDGRTINWYNREQQIWYSMWKPPWRLGFAGAFNCGVGLSKNDLIIFLAADDKMMPTCIEECVKAFDDNKQKDAWYSLAYELQDGTTHNAPNNVAMITKDLWRFLGGFPPSAFAAPDAMMISILLKHAPDKLYRVKNDTPLQWLRQHSDQDTLYHAATFHQEVISIRNIETNRFKPNPEWAKRL